VNLFGSDVARLHDAAAAALDLGLDVWVQSRMPDASRAETVAHVRQLAVAVEPLRAAGGPVRLSVGCELTIFASGILPGRSVEQRGRRLAYLWPLLPLWCWRLDRLLARAVAAARRGFGGHVAYGAGSWEVVRWSRFDSVGVNLYRDASNRHRYAHAVEALRRPGLPLFITELGCCAYPGADDRGAEGDGIVDWEAADGPVLTGDHVRDEAVQARYLDECLEELARAGVDGAFVFEYSEPSYPRHPDPRRDLDVAGFGLVAVHVDDTPTGVRFTEEPKAAFAAVAERFGGRNVPHRDRRLADT
jgi:hypothetical protein